MSAADEIEVPPRRRVRFRIAVALVSLGVVLLLGLWLARVPIATGFIDRELAAKRVTARYRIADLGFGRQRLTNVVIGDPALPDLVADWIETRVDVGAAGPRLAGVRAGRVRIRGRLVGGRLSLGAIDQLLPASSGQPFALPAIDLAVQDGRMRLETPAGTIGLRLAGRGRLDDGFRGTVAMAGDRLAVGDCAVDAPRAVLAIAVRDAAPSLAGPVRARETRCAGARIVAPAVTVSAALGAVLDRWSGRAAVSLGQVTTAAVTLKALRGYVDFSGDARGTAGRAALTSGRIVAEGITAQDGAFDGQWRVAPGRMLTAGRVSARGAAIGPARRRAIARLSTAAAGTPAAPLAAQAALPLARAATEFDIAGEIGVGTGSRITIKQVTARAANGVRASFGDGEIAIGDPAGVRVAGVAALGGGGLPAVRATIAQAAPGAAITGTVTVAPYAAGAARLVLAPIRFAHAPGATRITTAVDLSGPFGDGRVERLRLPIAARIGAGAPVINPGCAPLAFDRLAIGGLALRPARLGLCAGGGGLLAGARIAAPRLAGMLGGSPMTLQAASAEVRTSGIALDRLAVRLGSPDRITRLDVARLDGRIANGAIAGRFAGAGGQIGNVPLLLSEAAGDWRFARGVLSLGGALKVADAAAAPRFQPLAGRDVTLQLAAGQIEATGALFVPGKDVKVADVTLRHVLASGRGAAQLRVPGIVFGEGLQPEALTRLTFGVIADVKGEVTGTGDIAWSPEGITSTGVFRTDGTDLAAAFGPVTGIRGEIRFTDLLNLESAPGQVATVASINPGVPVTDGRIVYRTLPGNRVAVDSGRWPFAGGTLTLEPTLLDFSAQQARRMTFRIDGMEAAQFLQQFDFKNLDATGVFDGVLPMVFDDSGGRIENGRLSVRSGGGTLAYVGDLTEKDLGTWGNIAFQALKSLRYRNLEVVMNGPLAGEMITEVRFAGISQGEGAKSNFLVRRLQRLPFVFNIRIQAPFRGLLDSAASFYDPRRLIERNLPQLLEEQNKRAAPPTIQPPASETMP